MDRLCDLERHRWRSHLEGTGKRGLPGTTHRYLGILSAADLVAEWRDDRRDPRRVGSTAQNGERRSTDGAAIGEQSQLPNGRGSVDRPPPRWCPNRSEVGSRQFAIVVQWRRSSVELFGTETGFVGNPDGSDVGS